VSTGEVLIFPVRQVRMKVHKMRVSVHVEECREAGVVQLFYVNNASDLDEWLATPLVFRTSKLSDVLLYKMLE
jgi:hypothetical protein